MPNSVQVLCQHATFSSTSFKPAFITICYDLRTFRSGRRSRTSPSSKAGRTSSAFASAKSVLRLPLKMTQMVQNDSENVKGRSNSTLHTCLLRKAFPCCHRRMRTRCQYCQPSTISSKRPKSEQDQEEDQQPEGQSLNCNPKYPPLPLPNFLPSPMVVRPLPNTISFQPAHIYALHKCQKKNNDDAQKRESLKQRTTFAPASSVLAIAITEGCACAANAVSSHQHAVSALQKDGSLDLASYLPFAGPVSPPPGAPGGPPAGGGSHPPPLPPLSPPRLAAPYSPFPL
jgi:hypothetical protein